MAINKNFVIKNGVQVGTDLIVGDSDTKKVGIGTTIAGYTLHVAATNAGGRGGIGATDAVITGVGTIKDLLVTGFSGFSSDISVTGIVSARSFGIGTTEIIDRGMRLSGIASLDAITINTIEQAIRVGPNSFTDLKVTGISTFIGIATFSTGIDIKSGVSTFSAPLRLGFAHTTDHAGVALGATVGFGTSAFFRDDAAIFMGSDSDLKIHHDGSNSRIQDVGTGDLIIQGSADIKLQSASAENYIVANDTGSVDVFFDNSKKLETTSGGLKVTGITTLTDRLHVEAGISTFDADVRFGIGATVGFGTSAFFRDDAAIFLGNDSDLKIHHDGSNSRIEDQGTGRLKINTNLLDIENAAGTESMISASENGAVELYFDNSKKVETTSGGLNVTGITTFSDRINVVSGVSTFQDDAKLTFGAQTDLLIQHDGTDTEIYNKTGNLKIRSNDLDIQDYTNGHSMITADQDGSVDLYYDNYNALQTTPQGINVSGVTTSNRLNISGVSTFTSIGSNLIPDTDGSRNIGAAGSEWQDLHIDGTANIDTLDVDATSNFADDVTLVAAGSSTILFDASGLDLTFQDNIRAKFGTGKDLAIFHDGIDSYLSHTGSGVFRIEGNGSNIIALRPKSGENSLNLNPDGAVDLYYDNSKKVETTSGGLNVTGITTISDRLQVTSGISTFYDTTQSTSATTGAVVLDGGLGVAKNVNIGGNLTVTGTTTLNGGTVTLGDADTDNVVFSADVDSSITPDDDDTHDLGSATKEWRDLHIDGIAHLDNVEAGIGTFSSNLLVSGISTFTGAIDANGGASIDNVRIGVSDNNEIDTVSGNLTIDSNGGTVTVDDNLQVNGQTDLNGDINLGNATSDTITVTGRFDSSLLPSADTQDLGSSDQEWDGLFIDGTAHIDVLDVDETAFVTTKLTVGTGVTIQDNGNVAIAGITTTTDTVNIAADNKKLLIGASQDLEIYHDSNHSFISNTGTGGLILSDASSGFIYLRSNDIRIQNAAGSENSIICTENGAVSLHFDSAETLTTTADGVEVGSGVTIQKNGGVSIAGITTIGGALGVAGNVTITNQAPALVLTDTDNNSDFNIQANGGLLSFNDSTNSATRLQINSDGDIKVGSAITFQQNGGVSISGLTTANGGVQIGGGNLTLQDSSGTSDDRIVLGTGSDLHIYFDGTNSFIKEPNSVAGQLIIDGYNGTDIRQGSTGDHMGRFIGGGAVELYHNNNLRLSTTDDGVDFGGTGSIRVPNGTTGQRNASPQAGDFRYNTTDGKFEGYTDSWGEIGGSGGVDETDTSVSTTSATSCGSFAKASFRSAAIIAQITQGSNYQVGRYLLIHDGTTVTTLEESAVATGSMLGTFEGVINGSNVEFRVTMSSSSSATVTTKIDTVTV